MGKDVYVRKYAQGWIVRKLGGSLATAVVATKKQAVEIGRYSAKMERSHFILLAEDGSEVGRTDYSKKPKRKKRAVVKKKARPAKKKGAPKKKAKAKR